MTNAAGPARVCLGLALTTAAAASTVSAQHPGANRPLPPAYFQRIQSQPDFFDIRHGWTARARGATLTDPVDGTLPMVIVLALFADSPEPIVSADEVRRSVFDGPSPHGTVAEYYQEVSRGRFAVEGIVSPWVRTGVTLADAVGSSVGLGADAMTAQYIVDALTAVDADVDFRPFDNDGPDGIPNSGDDDGVVDAVAIQFVEVAASCAGPAIWPHRSRVSAWTGAPFATNENAWGRNIVVDDYIMQSAVSCAGTEVQPPPTIAHELGHIIGLPDYYDATDGRLPEFRRWVLGCWSLMAAGSWGCGLVGSNRAEWTRPTHMTAWEKVQLGWLDTEDVIGSVLNAEYELEPVISSGRILRVPLSPAEFLLIENRQRLGFDGALPGSGVLVYHVEPERDVRPCAACAKLYQVALLEADGNEALKLKAADGGDRGVAGDLYGNDGLGTLTNVTQPSTRLNGGGPSPVSIYSIRMDGDVARIRLSTVTLPLEVLLDPFLAAGERPIDPSEADYVDGLGNGNGRYDVGDLRRYLLDHPSVR